MLAWDDWHLFLCLMILPSLGLMKPKVYIETSIPSFYHETRTSPEAVARREWTRRWWHLESPNYELFTSEAVYAEMAQTPESKRQMCIAFLDVLAVLPIEAEIASIVEAYITHKIMPNNGLGDALHLAIASYYECDFCSHGIANIWQMPINLST
jgi:predicted nucleic acid-binding protein